MSAARNAELTLSILSGLLDLLNLSVPGASFWSAYGGLPAYVPAEVLERSVVARGDGDRDEPTARRGAQLAVLASAELPTLPHKVCDQLVDLFVPAVVHESPPLMQQQENLISAMKSPDTVPNRIQEKSGGCSGAP
jgi:hypothetical protein